MSNQSIWFNPFSDDIILIERVGVFCRFLDNDDGFWRSWDMSSNPGEFLTPDRLGWFYIEEL